MELKKYVTLALTAGALWLIVPAYAQDTPTPKSDTNSAAPTDRQIYGSQLMTPQERATYREKMRSLKTQQEREQFRVEHHQLMQERAKERGVTLPDQPSGPGMGPGSGMMGPNSGMGPGMGPGSGMMGPGSGMGPGAGRP